MPQQFAKLLMLELDQLLARPILRAISSAVRLLTTSMSSVATGSEVDSCCTPCCAIVIPVGVKQWPPFEVRVAPPEHDTTDWRFSGLAYRRMGARQTFCGECARATASRPCRYRLKGCPSGSRRYKYHRH